MSMPLQIVCAEPSVSIERSGLARDLETRFVWDDQPEPARRAARQARALLEVTGARGEGGFARLIVGDVIIDEEPAPVVTLRVTLGEPTPGAMSIPEHIGLRVLDATGRRQALATMAGFIADVAASEHARAALQHLATVAREGTYVLGAAARFASGSLAEALAARMATQIATRVAEARAVPIEATAPAWPELAVAVAHAEALAERVATDGPELAKALAAQALDDADVYAERVRKTIDERLAAYGFAALAPLCAMVEGLRREVTARLPTPAAIGPLNPPARAALDAAERTFAELAHDVRAWPLETAGALGGGVLASAAIGPFVTSTIPGGGWALVGGVAAGLWWVASFVTRAAQALSRRHARRMRDDAEAAYADAWRAAARRWFEPVARAATRRALLRLDGALADEHARLKATAAEVDALVRRPLGRAKAPTNTSPFERELDLGPARDVLSKPIEPLFRRLEAELKDPEWRAARPILQDPDGLARAARTQYAELAQQLPLATRTDVADALRDPARATLAELRSDLARWLPDGLPARRFVALPAPLGDALPESARFDERLTSSSDAWLCATWRPA